MTVCFCEIQSCKKTRIRKGQSKALAEENLLTGRKGPTVNKQLSSVGHKYPVNYKINFIQNDEAGLLNFGLFCVIFLVVKGIIRILSHLIRYQLSWGG